MSMGIVPALLKCSLGVQGRLFIKRQRYLARIESWLSGDNPYENDPRIHYLERY
jgi:hypothetical protein